MTTTMCISELNDAAYTLAPSGFEPPLLASTRTSLLACSLDFGQVGLGHNSCPHPLGNNNEFHALTPNPNASGLTRRDLIHTFGWNLLWHKLLITVNAAQAWAANLHKRDTLSQLA
jgi:hypothetical protein